MTAPKVKSVEGGFVERKRENDAAEDLRDIDGFGLPLDFDAQGNLVGGKPRESEQSDD